MFKTFCEYGVSPIRQRMTLFVGLSLLVWIPAFLEFLSDHLSYLQKQFYISQNLLAKILFSSEYLYRIVIIAQQSSISHHTVVFFKVRENSNFR